VLNQAFVTRELEGSVQHFLRLAVGKRSQLCPVHPKFRIIAVVEQEHAYNELDLPLLNRLEKQLLKHTDLCEERKKTGTVTALSDWVQHVQKECGGGSLAESFPGFHDSTLASLVLAVDQNLTDEMTLHKCKEALVACGTPLAVLKSPALRRAPPFPKTTSCPLAAHHRHQPAPNSTLATASYTLHHHQPAPNTTLTTASCTLHHHQPEPSTTLTPAFYHPSPSPYTRKVAPEHFEDPVSRVVVKTTLHPGLVRCAFSDRMLHLRMPLDPTHVHMKLLHTCDQWHSSRVSAPLTGWHA
jgi:hypothetical protein